MKISHVTTDYLASKMYIISENKHCMLIDSCDNIKVISAIRSLTVDCIFLTHEHFDHINGAEFLSQKYSAPVIAGAICAQRTSNPVLNCSRHFNAFSILRKQPCRKTVTDYICKVDKVIEENSVMQWQDHTINFLFTPGHSDSCFSLYVDKMLFSGDAILFKEDRTPVLPVHQYLNLFKKKTLPLLFSLPQDTAVFPGHGNPFQLAEFLSHFKH